MPQFKEIDMLFTIMITIPFLVNTVLCHTPYCVTGGACEKPSNTILGCHPGGLSHAWMKECICAADPTWDKNILDCAMCWVDTDSYNGGNAYQLDIILKERRQIGSCIDPPKTTSNITTSLDICSVGWQVGYACGGFGKGVERCVCGYRYLWTTDMGNMAACPACLEKSGEGELAKTLRAWNGYNCGTDWTGTVGLTSTTTVSSSTRTTSSSIGTTTLMRSRAGQRNRPVCVYLAAVVAIAGAV